MSRVSVSELNPAGAPRLVYSYVRKCVHVTKYSPSISKLSTAQHTIKRNIEILLRAATNTHERRSRRITDTVKLRYTIDIVTKRIFNACYILVA